MISKYQLSMPWRGILFKFDESRFLPGSFHAFTQFCQVAVCGRTGCGKSSMFSAICGLYPISGPNHSRASLCMGGFMVT